MVFIQCGNGVGDIGLVIVGFYCVVQGVLQWFMVYLVQLLGNQIDGYQVWVVMVLGDDKNIIFNVFIDYVLWIFVIFFGVVDIQFFMLVQGVVYQFLMSIDFFVVDGEDFVWLCWQIVVKEIVEFMFVDKVDVGGIFFFCGDQIQFFGDFMYLWFFQFIYWEQVLGNLFVVKGVEEVVLIFVVVEVVQQLVFIVDIGVVYIVFGGDVVGVEVFGSKFEEGFKFDFFIVQNIWVWCVVGFVFFQEEFKDVILIFGGKVNGVQFNVQFIVDCLCIGKVGGGGVVFFVVVFFLVFYEQVFYFIFLLQQQVCGD